MIRKPTAACDNAIPLEDRLRSRAGITIVEVLLALSIFAVFSVGTCKLLTSHRKILDMSRDHYIAANLAKDRMELARTFDFEELPRLRESQLLIDESGIPNLAGHYRRTTTVSAVSSNLFELAVTVDIQNRKTLQFAPAEQTISTYIAKHL